jgi:hypothetical protein
VSNQTSKIASANSTTAKATNKVGTQREFTPEEIDNLERLDRQMEELEHKSKTSSFLSFEVDVKERIEFNPALTQCKPNMIFGKVQRLANGEPKRGPNGEMYKESDGSILMGLNGQPAKPSTKWLYYGWHYGNKEEHPLEWAIGKQNHEKIRDFMKDLHTTVFDITKKKGEKERIEYKIMPVLSVDPSELQQDDGEYEASQEQ